MKLSRFLLMTILLLGVFTGSPAHARWLWFGESTPEERSGLDFSTGYDLNTVTTMAGSVASTPHQVEGGHMLMDVQNPSETMIFCIGPKTFWEAKGIAIRTGDQVVAKGSKAQGQDGKTYLMVQRLTNKTTGSELELRNDKGQPFWSGRNRDSSSTGGSSQGGMRFRGGMTRGGGSGMRR